MGDVDADKDDRPLEPPRLISVEVLLNPFDDITPRNLAGVAGASDEGKAAAAAAAEAKKKKRKKQGKKDFKLLSFGEEADQEEKELEAAQQTAGAGSRGIKSAHDALDDEKFSKDAAYDVEAERKAADRQKNAVAADESLRKAIKTAAKGAKRLVWSVSLPCLPCRVLFGRLSLVRISGLGGNMGDEKKRKRRLSVCWNALFCVECDFFLSVEILCQRYFSYNTHPTSEDFGRTWSVICLMLCQQWLAL